MCVRIVLVLVLCCVQSWAQRDPTLSRGFQNRDENPRMYPHGRLLPLDQFPSLTDVSEHPYILATPGYEAWPRPIIVQSPGFPNIPENTGMPPEERPPPFDHSSDIPGIQEHPQGRPPFGQSYNIPGMQGHPQGRPPPFAQSFDIPGMQEHSQGRPPPFDHSSDTPGIQEHPQGRPPFGQSSNIPGMQEHSQGRPPPFDHSSDIPGIQEHPQGRPPFGQSSNIPGMQEHSQGRPPPFDHSSDIPGIQEHPQGRPPFGQSSNIPGMQEHSQGRPPPFDHSSDIPGIQEHPQGRPPFGQSSNIPGMQEHPQGRPPSDLSPDILGIQSPAPGTPAFPGPPGKHPDKTQPPPATMDSYNVTHADLPRNLTVVALPLVDSDHELQLNVSWVPSSGVPANGYSLDVKSVTNTSDCDSQLCYHPNIPKNVTSVLVPSTLDTVVGKPCAIRPGCAYLVTLQADPWDGITIINLTKELRECEAGVCSCAHSPRLPVPVVSTERVTFNNRLANVSWTLPTPSQPQRLPAKLRKQSYIVALYKEMPTQANKTKIFTRLIPVQVNTSGLVFKGDTLHWQLLAIPLELHLLARVQLVDERGCVGPAGNATVFDPVEDVKVSSKSKLSLGVYATLGALIGAWAMGAVFVLSARVVKRVLKSFRPAPVSAPLEPLRRRPAWFPLQLRT